jgi:hypothetical protein
VWDFLQFDSIFLLSPGRDYAIPSLELENRSLGPSLNIEGVSLSPDWDITDAPPRQPGFHAPGPTYHSTFTVHPEHTVDVFNSDIDSGDSSSLTCGSTPDDKLTPPTQHQSKNPSPLFSETISDFIITDHVLPSSQHTDATLLPMLVTSLLPSLQELPILPDNVSRAILPIPRDNRQIKCPKCSTWFRHQGQLK